MKTLNLFLLFLFLFSTNSYSLPKCEGGDPLEWDKCIGTIILPDKKWEKGKEYIGEFRNGKPNGYGTAIWLDDPGNNKYEGKWKNGKRHGQGIQNARGYRYEVTWVNGSMKGKGIAFFPESIQNEFNYKSMEGTLDDYTFTKGKAVFTYMDDSKVNVEFNEESIVTRAGQWYSQKSENEFEEKTQIYFFSAKISPNKPLSFPYTNSDPVVGVGCEKREEKDWCWVYLNFKSLNIMGGDIQDGYTDHDVRVKLDSGKIENLRTKLITGGKTLYFYNDLKINNYIIENKKLLIEINHYGDGRRHYKIDTLGFDLIMDSNFPNQYWMETR